MTVEGDGPLVRNPSGAGGSGVGYSSIYHAGSVSGLAVEIASGQIGMVQFYGDSGPCSISGADDSCIFWDSAAGHGGAWFTGDGTVTLNSSSCDFSSYINVIVVTLGSHACVC